jgi:hypothetical protein
MAVVQPARADTNPSLAEADQLFATALGLWDQSTSIAVEQLLQRALALRQSLLPASDPSVARAQDQLGRVYYNRGISGDGATAFRRAQELFAAAATAVRESLGPSDLSFADYLGDLGAALRELGRYADASLQVCRSLAIRRAALPATAPVLAASLNNLSLIAAHEGRRRDAAILQALAQRVLRGVVGKDDPARLALNTYCSSSLTS